MNGKQAKKLRRIAERVTAGAPGKNYVSMVHEIRVMSKRGPRFVERRTVKLVECTRGLYRHMKADYRSGIKAVLS